VGLVYRDIEYNDSSSFYSYLLKDIYFSDLKYFAHKSGRRSKEKHKLVDQISQYGVQVTKNNDVFQGLPIPPKLTEDITRLNGETRHWVLSYHDLDETVLFVLFPSSQDQCAIDLVNAGRDLDDLKFKDIENHIPPYSFYVDRLYLWPRTIVIKDDQKIRGGMVFDIPHIFLSREDTFIRDYNQFSATLDRETAQDIIEFQINASLPKVKFFNLFYDKNGLVIFIRSSFHIGEDFRFPNVFYEPKGCEWKNKKKFDIKSKKISVRAKVRNKREWLIDS